MYAQVERGLYDANADRLRSTVQAKWTRSTSAPPGADRLTVPSGITTAQMANLPREITTEDVAVRLVSSAGNVIGATTGFPGQATIPNAQLILVSDARARSFEIRGRDHWLVYEVPLYQGRDLFGYLQGAMDLSASDRLLADLRTAMLIAYPAAVVASVVFTILVTTLLERPLRRVAETARRVGQGELGARSGIPPGRNEAYLVASAFDDMVGRLETVLESQRRFLADASHELKTPLAAVGGMAELLREGADEGRPEQRRLAVMTIEREVDRMGRLVSDLLTLSRAEQRPPLGRDGVDLGELARDAVREARELAPGRRIDARTDGFVPVCGDRETLRRAVRNLVDNAVRHTSEAGHIEVAARADPQTAVLEVRDTGEGIPPEDVPHVFERFYRADPSRARTSGGSGLGLAIVRSVVEWHGGSVDLASEPGRGTTVTIRLPIAAELLRR
jgi:two-component system OmpR family sensor kinase